MSIVDPEDICTEPGVPCTPFEDTELNLSLCALELCEGPDERTTFLHRLPLAIGSDSTELGLKADGESALLLEETKTDFSL